MSPPSNFLGGTKGLENRGRLAQSINVRFVMFRFVRPWFEACRTPGYFHVRIYFALMHDPESLKHVGISCNLTISDSKQLLSCNL